jgi:hypothetical protein
MNRVLVVPWSIAPINFVIEEWFTASYLSCDFVWLRGSSSAAFGLKPPTHTKSHEQSEEHEKENRSQLRVLRG